MPGASGTFEDYELEEDPETAAKKKQLARMMGSRYTEGAPGGEFSGLIRGLPSPEEAAGSMGPGLGPVAGALSPTNMAKFWHNVMRLAEGKKDPEVLKRIVRVAFKQPDKFNELIEDITTKQEALRRSIERRGMYASDLPDYEHARAVWEPLTKTVGIDPEKVSAGSFPHEMGHALDDYLRDLMKNYGQLPGGLEDYGSVQAALKNLYKSEPETINRLSGSTGVDLRASPSEAVSQTMSELGTGSEEIAERFPPELVDFIKRAIQWGGGFSAPTESSLQQAMGMAKKMREPMIP